MSAPTQKTLRGKRNADIIRRMRCGDSLSHFNAADSWYPPRPSVEKDAELVAKLYGKSTTAKATAKKPVEGRQGQVVMIAAAEEDPS